MKLSPAEKNIYTILAERAGMKLDDWLQSLPSAELARLEADAPDIYRDLMIDFAKRMLDPSTPSPFTSTTNPQNYRICPSCNQSKYAGAYPNGATICLRCTRKTEESEPEPDPPPQQEKKAEAPRKRPRKTCTSCHQPLHMTEFRRGSPVCKSCETVTVEALPPAQTDPPADEASAECRRCNQVKPADQFSLIQGVCSACMTVAKAEAKAAMERKKRADDPEKVIPGA